MSANSFQMGEAQIIRIGDQWIRLTVTVHIVDIPAPTEDVEEWILRQTSRKLSKAFPFVTPSLIQEALQAGLSSMNPEPSDSGDKQQEQER